MTNPEVTNWSEISADSEGLRLKNNIRLFFSTWAKTHAEEIKHTGFLDSHPAQDPDMPLTPAVQPEAGESLADFAHDIRMRVAFSFGENIEQAERFFASLHQEYPYPGGNGRTYLEVLTQDYLEKVVGVAPVLAHLDEGLSDVPRITGLLRSTLVGQYGEAYLDCVGEVASKTLAFETIYENPVPDTLAVFGDVDYVAPRTDSVPKILAQAGLSEADYQEIAKYINTKATFPIARALRDGKIRVFSASGKRANIVRNKSGQVVSGKVDTVDENAARLIGFAGIAWPIAIINDEVKLGPFMPIQKPDKTLSREQQNEFMLWQIENTMGTLVDLGNQILSPEDPKPTIKYKRATAA